MRLALVIDESSLRLLRIPGEPALLEPIDIARPEDAVRLLTPYLGDPLAMLNLRQALQDDAVATGLSSPTEGEIIERLSRRLFTGQILVGRIEREKAALAEADEPPPEQAPASTVQRKLTWIEFLVINDLTGKPVPWVRLIVTLPNGDKAPHTTDSDGLIRIDEIEPGTCDVTCDLKNARLEETLAFIATGPKTDPPKYPPDAFPPDGTIQRIAEIEAHKVKRGQTLEALAGGAGMTWQDLAYFNWGVRTPGEVNEKLYQEVGCTKTTSDGANYVFDDTDNPGIIYIPKVWSETGLATTRQHIFRVKPMAPFKIVLEDEFDHRIPETPFEITFSDKARRTGKLGLSGMAAITDPPWGAVRVVYTDLDDINHKSLAACARDCFDSKDFDHLYRVLQQGPNVIREAVKAYDKYFNTYTGKGLVEDVYQDLSDNLALMAVVGLLARAGLPTREKAEFVEWAPFDDDDAPGAETTDGSASAPEENAADGDAEDVEPEPDSEQAQSPAG